MEEHKNPLGATGWWLMWCEQSGPYFCLMSRDDNGDVFAAAKGYTYDPVELLAWLHKGQLPAGQVLVEANKALVTQREAMECWLECLEMARDKQKYEPEAASCLAGRVEITQAFLNTVKESPVGGDHAITWHRAIVGLDTALKTQAKDRHHNTKNLETWMRRLKDALAIMDAKSKAVKMTPREIAIMALTWASVGTDYRLSEKTRQLAERDMDLLNAVLGTMKESGAHDGDCVLDAIKHKAVFASDAFKSGPAGELAREILKLIEEGTRA